MDERWLVRGATVVSDGAAQAADVRIAAGRIAAVGPHLDREGAEEVDAAGKFLLPGLIDDQVHFREPGMAAKGCIATESAAAVAGGITSFLEMPNTDPPTVDAHALAAKLETAAADSRANYGFYLGATGTNCDQVARAGGLGACGIKVFLGASTGGLLVKDQSLLEEVFAAVPPGMVLAAHCEDADRIAGRQERLVREGGGDIPMSMHPVVRDAEACLMSTRRAIDLARRHGTRLHVLHLSTAVELDLFEPGPVQGKQVTAEACVHHLWFCEDDYGRLAGRIKCNPAIKSASDRAALRAALGDGRIDVVATDHAPHLLEEKQGPYASIAAGLPQVGESLLVLLELHRMGVLALTRVAELAAHNPAALFGIRDRGHIRPGQHADLVLVDLSKPTHVSDESSLCRCGWTPYDGQAFGSSVEKVWVGGRLAASGGKVAEAMHGSRLEYAR